MAQIFTMENVSKLNLNELQQLVKHISHYGDETIDIVIKNELSCIIY